MIEVKGLKKYYKKEKAIENINFTIQNGEVVGIFGANGAGKTTLLKAMMKLIKIDSGEILIDEKPINYKTYEDIAFITEECSMFNSLNINEHKEFFSSSFEKFNGERFEKLIDFFELNRTKKVETFSKGQKAKLEVAIGFSKGAKYILMDEPFLGNDIFTRSDFLKMMAGFMKPHEIIIITTHLITEIENFISRAIFIKDGTVVGDYQLDELLYQSLTLLDVTKDIFNYDENKIINYL